MKEIRIGSGAGFSGDRIEPAVELAENGDIQYLVFECLAERTIAIAQQTRLHSPNLGYDPHLVARMDAVLPICLRKGIKVVTNMGAANPLAAARKVATIAAGLGLGKVKVAAVLGDDVTGLVRDGDFSAAADFPNFGARPNDLVSANVYLGAGSIAEALEAGAQVVITGRCSDVALFLGPLVHELGWALDDWHRLGQGTVVGHLLECAGQITGGYFADPGYKDVPDMARLGFPFADVRDDGAVTLGKVPGSGGRITRATCKEQLLYEIHDPTRYLTPNVTADFSRVAFEPIGEDRVRVHGATGSARPETLKVSVGYRDGFSGEGQISYAGPGAVARGRLALDIVRERLRLIDAKVRDVRTELIGLNAVHGEALSPTSPEPYEIRARIVARAADPAQARKVGEEVEALYTNGPAGGGGVMKSVREVLAVSSAFVARDRVRPTVQYVEADNEAS